MEDSQENKLKKLNNYELNRQSQLSQPSSLDTFHFDAQSIKSKETPKPFFNAPQTDLLDWGDFSQSKDTGPNLMDLF